MPFKDWSRALLLHGAKLGVTVWENIDAGGKRVVDEVARDVEGDVVHLFTSRYEGCVDWDVFKAAFNLAAGTTLTSWADGITMLYVNDKDSPLAVHVLEFMYRGETVKLGAVTNKQHDGMAIVFILHEDCDRIKAECTRRCRREYKHPDDVHECVDRCITREVE